MAEGVDETTARELALVIAKSAKPKWLKDCIGQELTDAALEDVAKAAFDEAAHPRAKDGKFGEGDGSAVSKSGEPTMSHQDHYRAADKGNKASMAAAAKGDHKAAQGHREAAKAQAAKGLAKEKAAIASFKVTKPGDNIRLQTMKDEVARREVAKSAVEKDAPPTLCSGLNKDDDDDGLSLALSALEETQDVAKAPFHKSFVDSARNILPPYWFDQVHAHARSSAGGKASGTSRRHAKDPEAKLNDLWDRRAALTQEMEQIDKTLQNMPEDALKAVMPTSEIHVDVPLGSGTAGRKPKKPKKPKVKKLEDVTKRVRFDEDVQLAEAALTQPLIEQDVRMQNAQRLVAGMDWEMIVGASGAEDARARASRQLAQEIGHYDNKLQKSESIRRLKGLDLDLGSGQVRELGYLGLDLYPYDFGTAIHDVTLGLPFGDAQVRSIRLVNSLQYMTDFSKDATPLLLEIQRCLTYGGKLLYMGKGDLTLKGDWSQLPGLVLVAHEDSSPLTGEQEPTDSDLFKQVFERVRVRVPRVFGADPEWLGAEEETAEDIEFALTAMGASNTAEETMSDLIQTAMGANGVSWKDEQVRLGYMAKSAAKDNADITMGGGEPIRLPSGTAAEYKKIVYSVVTAPSELDFDGEYMDVDGIEKMAHDAYRDRVPIKSEHVSEPIGAHIVESYIAPTDFTMTGAEGPQFIPKGAWVIAIQFTDDEEWQKVLSGEYRGISVGGSALIEHR